MSSSEISGPSVEVPPPIAPAAAAAPFCAAQHAEVVSHDLEGGALPALFVLPLAKLNFSRNEHERPFAEELLRVLRRFAPGNDLVPLDALLTLSIAAFVALVR